MSTHSRQSETGRRSTARRRLSRIASRLEAEFGLPTRTESRDLVGGLVRTILSQNTTDVNSSGAYLELRETLPTWDDVADAHASAIAAAIRRGGLGRIKAKRIKSILREIRSSGGSLDLGFLRKLPTDEAIDYLTALEGVGAKTAACVALFDLGRDVMPVDTHVHRVVGRLGVVGRPRSPEATYEALRDVVPAGKGLSLHVNIIRLGRSLCRPARPRCRECPVLRYCEHGLSEVG